MNRHRCGYDTVFLSEYIRFLSKIRTQCIITYYVHNRFSISYMFLNGQATHRAAYFSNNTLRLVFWRYNVAISAGGRLFSHIYSTSPNESPDFTLKQATTTSLQTTRPLSPHSRNVVLSSLNGSHNKPNEHHTHKWKVSHAETGEEP